jgi:hypothetical protein
MQVCCGGLKWLLPLRAAQAAARLFMRVLCMHAAHRAVQRGRTSNTVIFMTWRRNWASDWK